MGGISILQPTSNTLTSLADTVITAISDNELLQYDSGTSTWENRTITEAGILKNTTDTLTGDLTVTSAIANGSTKFLVESTGVSGSESTFIRLKNHNHEWNFIHQKTEANGLGIYDATAAKFRLMIDTGGNFAFGSVTETEAWQTAYRSGSAPSLRRPGP